MGATKQSEFDKVLSAWDVLVIAFGAMIGWAWVVSTGDWIMNGGVIGAMLGFVIGGIMVFFVGLTYAELTSAMPQCGGEHVFSFKAMGPIGSFICTWAIVLGYVSVVCFEACALPTIITYLYPDFLQGYLYSVAGFDVYASSVITAIAVCVVITYANIIGTKTAAILQTILTAVIGGVGILLVVASVYSGTEANLEGQLFMGLSTGDMLKGTLAVAVMTPFYFIGFDVIPQAAEEITISLKKIGRILILSIILAVIFYALIIFSVGYIMNNAAIGTAMQGVGGLVTADAMAKAFDSSLMAKVLIIGGLCGIITSWNSFLIGGSRAMYSMAESYMIPRVFAKLHPQHKTPVNALLLIGLLSILSQFFGKKMLVWVVDAGNFGCCVAYCMVAISFIILRKTQPDMPRPYKVRNYRFVGVMAVLMSGFMVAMYMIPGSGAALVPQEWVMVLAWCAIGAVFGVYCKVKYGAQFATHIDVAVDEGAFGRELEFQHAVDVALRDIQDDIQVTYAVQPIHFSFCMPVDMVFGAGKHRQIGSIIQPYGKKALIVTDRKTSAAERLMSAITDSLAKAGVAYAVYAHGGEGTKKFTLDNGVQAAAAEGCDMVLAVGTGSVMNYAKALAYAAANGMEKLLDGSGVKRALPIVCVPTKYMVDEEYSSRAVIVGEGGEETCINDASLAARAVVIDQECMSESRRNISLAAYLALCRNIEAYVSSEGISLSAFMALQGVELLKNNIAALYEDEEEGNAHERILLGCAIGAMVSTDTMRLAAEAMKKKAAALDVAYEEAMAVVFPAVLARLCRTDIFRYGKLARMLGGLTAEDCSAWMARLAENLQLDTAELSDETIAELVNTYISHTANVAMRDKDSQQESAMPLTGRTAWDG